MAVGDVRVRFGIRFPFFPNGGILVGYMPEDDYETVRGYVAGIKLILPKFIKGSQEILDVLVFERGTLNDDDGA